MDLTFARPRPNQAQHPTPNGVVEFWHQAYLTGDAMYIWKASALADNLKSGHAKQKESLN